MQGLSLNRGVNHGTFLHIAHEEVSIGPLFTSPKEAAYFFRGWCEIAQSMWGFELRLLVAKAISAMISDVVLT